MNLNKQTITYIFIIIFIIITFIHLYKINNKHNKNDKENFADLMEDQNLQGFSVFINSMSQVFFGNTSSNKLSLETIMNQKASKTELTSLDNKLTVSINKITSDLNDAMPPLSVISYAGALAPTGWQLCNGSALKYTNNSFVINTDIRIAGFKLNPTGNLVLTPDLKGRFILGNGSDGIDRVLYHSAGEANVTLTEAQMPSHNHNFTGMGFGTNWFTVYANSGGSYGSEKDSKLVTTNNTGGGLPHNNMPPYYVLTYIIKQLSPIL